MLDEGAGRFWSAFLGRGAYENRSGLCLFARAGAPGRPVQIHHVRLASPAPGANAGVMQIDYPARIRESEPELLRLEELLRGQVTCDRVRMLRLLKNGAFDSREAVAGILGYSTRQLRRWWRAYEAGGMEALLEVGTPGGSRERITREAWRDLYRQIMLGRFSRLEDVRCYLLDEHGIEYRSVQGVLDLLRRRGVDLAAAQRT